MNSCKLASQVWLVPFLQKYVLHRYCVTVRKLCSFLFVNSFTSKYWSPWCWDSFFDIPCTLIRFLFKIHASGILQLCVISCIGWCDVAFCLPIWKTGSFELKWTNCQPLDMKQSCSLLANSYIIVWVNVLLWKGVFAWALELTETWRVASYEHGKQHGLRINCGDFLCISLINDSRGDTLIYV